MSPFYRRQSKRLRNHDYGGGGYYFVTIVTHDRKRLFGEIINYGMVLNEVGQVAKQCWLDIPNHFPNVVLHAYVIMPDHIHGIVQIRKTHGPNRVASSRLKANDRNPRGTSRTLGSIVRGFKIGVTMWHRLRGSKEKIWLRDYWDTVIWNERAFRKITFYINNNPLKWHIKYNISNKTKPTEDELKRHHKHRSNRRQP